MPPRKTCPFTGCPESIAAHWVACESHWAIAPARVRRANLTAWRKRDVAVATAAAWVALLDIGLELEAAAVPLPPDHRGRWLHDRADHCPCRACAAIEAAVSRYLCVSREHVDLFAPRLTSAW